MRIIYPGLYALIEMEGPKQPVAFNYLWFLVPVVPGRMGETLRKEEGGPLTG
jgi:hypothetical protein